MMSMAMQYDEIRAMEKSLDKLRANLFVGSEPALDLAMDLDLDTPPIRFADGSVEFAD